MYFIHAKHVHHTVWADSGTQSVILVPHQSFYGSCVHFLTSKSLSTHAIPQNQSAILRWAETPLSNGIEAQVRQCVPPMDVVGVQHILHLECRPISNVHCPVVSTGGQCQLPIGHFLPVYWCHCGSVTCQSFDLLSWITWKNRDSGQMLSLVTYSQTSANRHLL